MGDWKEVSKGPTYSGPDDSTIMEFISGFGLRTRCTYAELRQQFGQDDAWLYFKESFTEQLERMVMHQKLNRYELNGTLYYSVLPKNNK